MVGPLRLAGEGVAWTWRVRAMAASRCFACGWFGREWKSARSGLVRPRHGLRQHGLRRHGWRRRGDLPLECSGRGGGGRRL